MKRLPKSIHYALYIALNIFFWIGVYFFYTFFLGYGSSNVAYVSNFSAFLMPVTILLSYFLILFLIPNYLLKKQYALFILYGVYTLIISFSAIILSVLYGLVFSSYLKEYSNKDITRSLPFIIFGIYFVVSIATAISLFIYSYLSNLKNQTLKNDFLKMSLQLKEQELKFLKLQIHPHFLFNALNTIYGYALKKADEAPEMILKLSNLLDYILYQVDKPMVALQDELHHIKEYISLEKMRFHDTLDIVFIDETHNSSLQIAPMLFIPFVENSFKHGRIIDGTMQITIRVSFKDTYLILYVKNSARNNHTNTPGIGLENIKKRLAMVYPNGYDLLINAQPDSFAITLSINTTLLNPLTYD